jgi:DNA (cytosine-5)-methyltransferase 1
MARIVGEVRPRFAFVENSPMLVGRGAAMVIGDLAKMGYDCQWCIVSASDCGAPHQRDRFWLVAYASELQCNGGNDNGRELMGRKQISKSGNDCGSEHVADTNGAQCKGNKRTQRSEQERANTSQPSWWASEPDVGRVAFGVAARVDRLKAIGNGQVPVVAAAAFKILTEAR